MSMSTKGRWAGALVGTVVVLATLSSAPPFGRSLSASATAAGDQVYVTPVTGHGSPDPREATALSDLIQFAVESQLAAKYPCATVQSSGVLGTILGFEKAKELLSATTPEEETSVLESAADALGARTMVIASYAQAGDQYYVTVAVMDSKTGQIVDKNTATGQGGGDVVTDLSKSAVNNLNVGLCHSYWDGSITIVKDITGESHMAATGPDGLGSGTITVTIHIYESISLMPPKLRQSSYVGLPTAQIVYESTNYSQTSNKEAYLDSCHGVLDNLTDTVTQTLLTTAADRWDAPVSIGLDPHSGKYTIYILGHDLLSKTTATKKHTAFSKAPCVKPEEPSAGAPGTDTLSIDSWDLKGTIDPSHPYVLHGHVPPPEPTTGGWLTTKLQGSWSLELKNPPSSGTP
jgi:hypothetical protein